jgi:hypothetical protein
LAACEKLLLPLLLLRLLRVAAPPILVMPLEAVALQICMRGNKTLRSMVLPTINYALVWSSFPFGSFS